MRARAGEPCERRPDLGDRRPEIRQHDDLGQRRRHEGRRQAQPVGTVMQHGLRHPVDDAAACRRRHQPGDADALAAGDEQLGPREGDDQRPVELGLARGPGGERHRGRAIRPDPDRVGGFPFKLADIEMVVARRSAPIDILRRLARDEAAVLPEILAGAGAPPSVQTVNHVGRDAASLEHQARQRSGERAAFAIGTSDRQCLLRRVPVLCCHQPIRVFNCRITSGMVRPSARAWNVRAMRCFSTGSARSSTSSIDGARRPSISARARTASIRD